MKPKNLKNVVVTILILLVLFVKKKTCTHKTKIFYRKTMNKVLLKLLVLRNFYIIKIVYNIIVLFYQIFVNINYKLHRAHRFRQTSYRVNLQI